jgi:hypothetical protein
LHHPLPSLEEVLEHIDATWEQVAFLALDGYNGSGRGIVLLQPTGTGERDLRMTASYVVPDPGRLDDEVTRLLTEYDPFAEILVMFEGHGGTTRTLRLSAGPGQRSPKRVWFFEVLRRLEEDPASTPETIPEWFWSIIDRFSDSEDL